MSGSLQERGKVPSRTCMKFKDWPEQDRLLWMHAVDPLDPFAGDSGGERASLRPLSKSTIEKGYGRWLTFLAGRGLLAVETEPTARITAADVLAYVQELQSLRNRKTTILNRLQELGSVAKVGAPAHDWSFISQLAKRVRGKPETARDKRSRLVGSNELLGLGMSLMQEAKNLLKPSKIAMAYRDGLMIALLALRPMRRGNFVGLGLGADLIRNGTGWVIDIPGGATKNHIPLELEWPDLLVDPLENYLAVHRPILINLDGYWKAPVGNRLWVSSEGSPLTEMAFYSMITRRTKAAFGRSINPHLFRDAAATSMAIHDPEHVRLLTAPLGHRNAATTERYYQQAQSLEAHRMFADFMVKLSAQPPAPSLETIS